MRRFVALTVCLWAALAVVAQTQQGFVKTKGRMVNGQHVAGQGLPGAMVTILGRSAVVTKNDGTFSFPITTNTFTVQSVQKNGYQLVDDDLCHRSFRPSANPIYVVMDTPSQIQADQLEAQRKIRRTLQQQLQRREDEIEALQVSLEEKQRMLDKLYKEQEGNEHLIAQMAKRYAELDYDQLDETNRRISDFIMNGELTCADSLLRTKGDIRQRVEELKHHEQANEQVRKDLEKSEALARQRREDLIRDCYSHYEISKMEGQYDSAAYYICLRADLDTLNVKYQIEAGDYLLFQNKRTDARIYYARGVLLLYGKQLAGRQGEIGAGATYDIVDLLTSLMGFADIVETDDILNPSRSDSAVAIRLYEVVIKSATQTAELCKEEGRDSIYTAFILPLAYMKNRFANLCYKQELYERSEALYNEALDGYKAYLEYSPKDSAYVQARAAYMQQRLSRVYLATKRYEEAERSAREAATGLRKYIATDSSYVSYLANALWSLGSVIFETKDEQRYPEALRYWEEAVAIDREDAHKNFQAYGNVYAYRLRFLFYLLGRMGQNEQCIPVAEEALSAYQRLAAEGGQNVESHIVNLMGNLSYYYLVTKQFEKAEQYAREASGKDSTQHWIVSNLACALLMKGQYNEAETLYRQLKENPNISLLKGIEDFAKTGAVPREREADVERIKQMLNE